MRLLKIPKFKRAVLLAFSPDGSQLCAANSEAEDHVGSVQWFDVMTGEVTRQIALDVDRVAVSNDLSLLAVGYSAETAKKGRSRAQWADLRSGEALDWVDVPGIPHANITSLAFRPGGASLAVGSFGKKALSHPWQHAVLLAPLKRGKPMLIGTDYYPGELAYSADGKWLALCGGPGAEPAIHLHRATSAAAAATFVPDGTRTRRLVFSPDGTTLAALVGKRGVLLATDRLMPRAELEGHTAQLNDAAFTPDGRRLLTVSHDGTARQWDAATGALHSAYTWAIGKLTAVAVAPDGLTAAAAGDKGQFIVWDLEE